MTPKAGPRLVRRQVPSLTGEQFAELVRCVVRNIGVDPTDDDWAAECAAQGRHFVEDLLYFNRPDDWYPTAEQRAAVYRVSNVYRVSKSRPTVRKHRKQKGPWRNRA